MYKNWDVGQACNPSWRRLAAAHGRLFGPGPRGRVAAPGRVNLIGEHTDYHGGLVLPLALDREVRVVFRPVAGRWSRVAALDLGEEGRFRTGAAPRCPAGHWLRYVAGAAAVLRAAGFTFPSVEAVIGGGVPIGAGLSSSAALLVAVLRAFALAGGIRLGLADTVRLGRQTEHEYAGVPSGIMDFVTAAAARPGPILLDCRTGRFREVPLPPPGWAFFVALSGEARTLARSAYRRRQEEGRRALERLGEESPRDLSLKALVEAQGRLDPVGFRRLRHVVSENQRVRRAVRALERGDMSLLGKLLRASHESLARDYEVSTPALDRLVERACALGGAAGARLTGGGFGGAVLILARQGAAFRLRRALEGASLFQVRPPRRRS